MTSTAIAVKRGGGGLGGKGSRRAVRWAAKNLLPLSDRFVLIHVIPTITSVPTPSGDLIPIEELDANVVAMYVEDVKAKFQEVFIPFEKLCKPRKMETLLLEGDNPASALVRYASESGIASLVLGSGSSNCLMRMLKGPDVPSIVLKHAQGNCDIVVVYRNRLITSSGGPLSTNERRSRHSFFPQRSSGSHGISELSSWQYSSSVKSEVLSFSEASSAQSLTSSELQAFSRERSSINSTNAHKRIDRNLLDSVSEIRTSIDRDSVSSQCTEQSKLQAELDQLRLELQGTFNLYNQVCEDLVHMQHKVDVLSSEFLEDTKRVNSARKREEAFRKIADEQRESHLEAVKEVEMARSLLAKEAYEKEIAELKALKVSLEKQKVVDALFSSDRRYKRYTVDEIEAATDFFSESKVIGEGAFGKVYKAKLDHIPVAIKVLRSDASEKKIEFLKEVEVLCQLRHPHLVLLLGACPERVSLVYEYMENGSLEDYISHRTNKPSLPWPIRFRIALEVACGLAFLHNSKPEPIVHRDLKPGNILLDQNYVSKIGDTGLAKLISDVVPESITEYRDSILAGTLYYMDPEYQRTGTLRPKSDLYAFGIVIMQLLTSRHPNGLLLAVENSVACGSFSDVLDKTVKDWPIAETEELVQIALKCSRLRCRDRPELETDVLPVLRKLADFAEASERPERNKSVAPSHFYCPILQEIMDDPHIAADGFSYEHKAISVWLERQNVSPVTKRRLQHKTLTPNHTLRSAIQQWRSAILSNS